MLLLVLGACQNDYPLEPTPCDDFCFATERVSCGFNDPASCVAECEAQKTASPAPECQQAWQSMLDCYRALPDEALCPWTSGAREFYQTPCSAESAAYYGCSGPHPLFP